MRALVTADTVGGVWTYARELVTGLVRRGVEVTLVSFGKIPGAEQTEWMEGLQPLDYRPTGFRLEWMQDAERDLALSTEYLQAAIEEVRPDIVHLNQYAYGSLAIDVPKVVVAHSDVVSWWAAVHGEEPGQTPWICRYRDTVSRGLAGADAVIAPSQWMLGRIELHYLKPARGRVIYNGRSPQLFDPCMTKSNRALSVGRLWDQGKQVSLLTSIEPPMPVVIAGSERSPESTAAVERSARSARIEFRGQLTESQLRAQYGEAAVYVATSRYEPFGLAPVEAALSRCAVVANDIPSFREMWGDSIYYFAMNDASSLNRALEHMAADPELRITYGNRAYDHAQRHFIADHMVDAYMGLYETLVPPRRAGHGLAGNPGCMAAEVTAG
jgi:glycogen(starch) synthase